MIKFDYNSNDNKLRAAASSQARDKAASISIHIVI